jgi:2-isopropylmalate synthase
MNPLTTFRNIRTLHDAVGLDIEMHTHNDFGMAGANSLAGIYAGANYVGVTVNGLGERAGNTCLQEIIMSMKYLMNMDISYNTTLFREVAEYVAKASGRPIPVSKPIVGANIFAHESGIHQHGMLNNANTYEIMRPETIGLSRSSLVLGKHSGRHAFEERLKQLGYELDAYSINVLFAQFKDLADRKKVVFDRDIEALVLEKSATQTEMYRLVYYNVVSGNQTLATASVRLASDKGIVEEACCGSGPVDAVFQAIEKAVGFKICLKDYQLKAVTAGEDALGEATVWVENEGRTFSGRGLSTDIIEASTKAYVAAINKMLAACGYSLERQIGGL